MTPLQGGQGTCQWRAAESAAHLWVPSSAPPCGHFKKSHTMAMAAMTAMAAMAMHVAVAMTIYGIYGNLQVQNHAESAEEKRNWVQLHGLRLIIPLVVRSSTLQTCQRDSKGIKVAASLLEKWILTSWMQARDMWLTKVFGLPWEGYWVVLRVILCRFPTKNRGCMTGPTNSHQDWPRSLTSKTMLGMTRSSTVFAWGMDNLRELGDMWEWCEMLSN